MEHLLIPQLSLAFLSSSPAHPYPGKAYRRLLLDNAVSADLLRRSRPRLRFSQKITSALMDEAVDSLSQPRPCTTTWRPSITPMSTSNW